MYIYEVTAFIQDTVCICYVYTCLCLDLYIFLFQTGFHGQQRDAVQSEVAVPAPVVDDVDEGSPCPEDGEFFTARPDAAEMEEAIGKFGGGLERQEQSGFTELQSFIDNQDTSCRGTSLLHGGQSSTDPLVPGW